MHFCVSEAPQPVELTQWPLIVAGCFEIGLIPHAVKITEAKS